MSEPLEVQLSPEQPDEVAAAVAAVLGSSRPEPDPWWQAGLDVSLET